MLARLHHRLATIALLLSAAVLAGVWPAPASAQESASVKSAPDMRVWSSKILAEGRSRFLFDAWDGPDLPIWAYIPKGADRKTAPIMFVLHGAKRDPRRYLEEWVQFADEDGFIIIAPEFAKGNFPGSRSYNLGNIWTKGGKKVNPEDIWSFSAIEPIFDRVVASMGGSQTNYTLYGHSAGSQFVHRFLFAKPDARVSRYLVANAGWYTVPDREIAFPYGLGGLGVTDDEIKVLLAKDVVVLLGDQDTDTKHDSLRRTKDAMAQGPHRFARGLSYFSSAKALAEEMDAEFNWTYRVIPGVAHSNGGIAKGAHDLVK
ncbi:hypothetical protein QWY75_05125 [Pontixanthobacter aestiaquae]|uniref:Alpha/beta hydrolase n=1 Tax=Pontixanthobacter aestiaquae TaxID=1509367 RepID=A0A844Z668_9SPHN|nr:alpha/beta hydrolase [Pontixanthobacter aestiaquae]MDN3645588.1 hypothetical protein [Pontixanthobacter aestiaquae]MXO83415.1 alpha/beta hydrolase [Pontixanthobacter aestiaquae]